MGSRSLRASRRRAVVAVEAGACSRIVKGNQGVLTRRAASHSGGADHRRVGWLEQPPLCQDAEAFHPRLELGSLDASDGASVPSAAIRAGYSVQFTSATALLGALSKAETEGQLAGAARLLREAQAPHRWQRLGTLPFEKQSAHPPRGHRHQASLHPASSSSTASTSQDSSGARKTTYQVTSTLQAATSPGRPTVTARAEAS